MQIFLKTHTFLKQQKGNPYKMYQTLREIPEKSNPIDKASPLGVRLKVCLPRPKVFGDCFGVSEATPSSTGHPKKEGGGSGCPLPVHTCLGQWASFGPLQRTPTQLSPPPSALEALKPFHFPAQHRKV